MHFAISYACKQHGPYKRASVIATLEWSINITIDLIRQGGLEINMNLLNEGSEPFKVAVDHIDRLLMDGSVMEDMADQVAVAVVDRTTIRQVTEEAAEVFLGTGKFVFPGAGTLLYKTPTLYNELDFLVETSYNGYVIEEFPSHGCGRAGRGYCRVDDFLGRKNGSICSKVMNDYCNAVD